jgi:hypothetical protein
MHWSLNSSAVVASPSQIPAPSWHIQASFYILHPKSYTHINQGVGAFNTPMHVVPFTSFIYFVISLETMGSPTSLGLLDRDAANEVGILVYKQGGKRYTSRHTLLTLYYATRV